MSHDWNICPVCRAHYFEPEGHSCDSARLAEAERLLRDVQREMSDFDGRWGTLDEIDAFLARLTAQSDVEGGDA
jgi:hypothetical protein